MNCVPSVFLSVLGCLVLSPASAHRADPGPEESNPTNRAAPPESTARRGRIVTADRTQKCLSVIDVATDRVVQIVPMPDAGEPTYVAHTASNDRLFVADRANDRVVVFDASDLSVEGTVPAGDGPFHCWADDAENQLWVTNDLDQTLTVVDTDSLQVLATIAAPADLVAAGYRVHDVNVAAGRFDDSAFVTMIQPGQPGHVLRYSTRSFSLRARREVGGDPHVSLRLLPWFVYVMSQDSGEVRTLWRRSLRDARAVRNVPNAHGAVMTTGSSRGTRYLYTTNIADGGVGGLVTIDTWRNRVIDTDDTPFALPHNIAQTPDGKKLYVTHSGTTGNRVSVFRVRGGRPTFLGSVRVGRNPFGLTFLP